MDDVVTIVVAVIMATGSSIAAGYFMRPKVNADAKAALTNAEVAESGDARAWVQEFRVQAKEASDRASAAEQRASAAEDRLDDVEQEARDATARAERAEAQVRHCTERADAAEHAVTELAGRFAALEAKFVAAMAHNETLMGQLRLAKIRPADPPEALST